MDMAFSPPFERPDGPVCGESGNAPQESLRPLLWIDLCGQLVASQDFRAAQATMDDAPARQTSFHGSAAQWLATIRFSTANSTAKLTDCAAGMPARKQEYETTVNPTPSVAGKRPSGIAAVLVSGATSFRVGAQD